MKISFKEAYKLLLAANYATTRNGFYDENVSLCFAGDDKTYVTVLWESKGEEYQFDIFEADNAKVLKNKNKLTFVTSSESDNEKMEISLFKKVPLV